MASKYEKNDLTFSVALGIIYGIALMLILAGVTFIFHGRVGWWMAPSAALLGCAMAWRQGSWRAPVIIILTVLASVGINALIFDTTYDSLAYHNYTTVFLFQGWNPVYEAAPTDIIWIPHYARAQELLAAILMKTGAGINASKALGLVLAFGVWCLCVSALKACVPSLNRKARIVVSLFLVLNPVVVGLVLTHYNDHFLYLELLGIVSVFCLWIASTRTVSPRWVLPALAFSLTVIAINTKFTHFFFCGLAWAVMLVWLLIFRRKRLAWIASATAVGGLLVGLFIVGWNPYITNILQTGDPCYPLLTGSVDIMTGNTPEFLLGNNRFLAFTKAQLSTFDTPWGLLIHPSPGDIAFTMGSGSSLLGFGPLFLPLLLISIAVMCFKCRSMGLWVIYICALLSTFVFPQAWWARYAPMIWSCIGLSLIPLCNAEKGFCIWAWVIGVGVALSVLHAVGRIYTTRAIVNLQIGYLKELSKHKNEPIHIATEEFPFLEEYLFSQDVNLTTVPLDSIEFDNDYNIGGRHSYDMPSVELTEADLDTLRTACGPFALRIFHLTKASE